MCETRFLGYGLYTIDINYVKYLHDIDSEVFYGGSKSYGGKPYLGLLVNLGEYTYLIPFTSAKEKHKKLSLRGYDHMLVVEKVSKKKINSVKNSNIPANKKPVYKSIDQDPYNVNQILAVLMFSKMIPVKDGLYEHIDIPSETDIEYRYLLMKEYSFCLMNQKEILERAKDAYEKRNKDNKNSKAYETFVNFKRAEIAADKYPSIK